MQSSASHQSTMDKNTEHNLSILIIAGIFPPDIGGPATYVPKIAPELIKRGCRITVIAMSDELEHDDSIYPFRVIRLERGQFKPLRFLKTVFTIMKYGRQTDLIFANELGVESAVANLLLGKPLVRKIVGDWAWEKARNENLVADGLEEFQKKKYCLKVELYRFLRSFYVRRSHRIITPSSSYKNIAVGWHIPEEKIEVIYNSVEERSPDFPPKDAVKRELNVPYPSVVTVGRLVNFKGIDGVIKAAAQIDKLNLIIIGDGPERKRLENLAETVASGRVIFTGMLERQEVLKYLRAADIFVLNSSYEGLPHIVLEAMQVETPVIATRVGGTPEVVKHEMTGLLVNFGDDDQLKASISRLLREPSLRDMLVKNAKSELKRRFSSDVMADETLKLLRQSVALPPSATQCPPLTSAVLFVGGTRYSYPLSEMHKKKFWALADVSENYVFAYSTDNRFRAFSDGAYFYLIPSKMPRIIRYPFFLFSALCVIIYTVIKHNVKIVICQSPYEGISCTIAKLPLRILRKPISLVTELHGDWEAAPSLYLTPRLRLMSCILGILGRSISSFVLRCSNVIRPVSVYLAEKLPKKLAKPTVTFIAHTDIESFLRPKSNSQYIPNPQYNGRYILYAGMLIYLKGVHVLIESMARVVQQYREQQLLIAGDGQYREELERLVCKLKLGNNIVFLGHLEQRALREYLQNCLVMVLPSFTEGVPRVVVEAMACGKPVIATAVGGVPEFIKDGENGFLVQPRDVETLAEKMIYFIQNPGIGTEMGDKGKHFISGILSTQKYVRNFERMIQMALECC